MRCRHVSFVSVSSYVIGCRRTPLTNHNSGSVPALLVGTSCTEDECVCAVFSCSIPIVKPVGSEGG